MQAEQYALWLASVRYAGSRLRDVPIAERDYRLCYEAVARDARALAHVPEKHRVAALVERAVSTHWRALLALERSACTARLCTLAALSVRGAQGVAVVLARSREPPVLAALARSCPRELFGALDASALPHAARVAMAIRYPPSLPWLCYDFDEATLRTIVFENIKTLHYVPNQSRALCKAAIRHHPDAIAHVDVRDAELWALHDACEKARRQSWERTLVDVFGPGAVHTRTKDHELPHQKITLDDLYHGKNVFLDETL